MSNKSSTGIGVTDRSIASMSGSSQKLMSQNLNRGALEIQNVGNAQIAIAFAPVTADGSDAVVTAALNTGGSFNIPATYGSFECGGGFIPLGAIYVIGTAGQPVTAFESS